MKKHQIPKNSYHWRKVRNYIEEKPDLDYEHASLQSYEAFKDWKFGVRIHFGLYSVWNIAGESWPFLMFNLETRERYMNLIHEFNPIEFDAHQWMDFFSRSGIKCMAFTTKHHEGFSLFDTNTKVKRKVNWNDKNGPTIIDCDTSFSVMDSPFKRDIVKELCDAAHEKGILIDLYFSHPDWFDADFRPYAFHPLQTPNRWKILNFEDNIELYITKREKLKKFRVDQQETKNISGFDLHVYKAPNTTMDERIRAETRHREQLKEILSNYGKIDMVCLDQWMGKEWWPYLKETIKMCRKIQPDVMFRARGIGNYGDYHTPEGVIPGDKSNTDMPWMVIYPLGNTFSYESRPENHKGTAWIIHNLIDTVAKGGNFMVGIGPNAKGAFHPTAIEQFENAGKWLEINGEGIYNTRVWEKAWKEGEYIRFTRSKDSNFIYCHLLSYNTKVFRSKIVKPKQGSQIYMLGYNKPLKWTQNDDTLIIDLPNEKKIPCIYAWTLKINILSEELK